MTVRDRASFARSAGAGRAGIVAGRAHADPNRPVGVPAARTGARTTDPDRAAALRRTGAARPRRDRGRHRGDARRGLARARRIFTRRPAISAGRQRRWRLAAGRPRARVPAALPPESGRRRHALLCGRPATSDQRNDRGHRGADGDVRGLAAAARSDRRNTGADRQPRRCNAAAPRCRRLGVT